MLPETCSLPAMRLTATNDDWDQYFVALGAGVEHRMQHNCFCCEPTNDQNLTPGLREEILCRLIKKRACRGARLLLSKTAATQFGNQLRRFIAFRHHPQGCGKREQFSDLQQYSGRFAQHVSMDSFAASDNLRL